MEKLIHIWADDFLVATINPNTAATSSTNQIAHLLEHLEFALGDKFELIRVGDFKFEVREKK